MNKPSKSDSIRASVGLSLLFLIVYGGTNWITAHRSDVGTWYYSWEHFIPFVPLMILPYMSIDLFFVAAPFTCSSRDELRILSRRISSAIVVAGIFFLATPLKFSTPVPAVAGWTGALFHFLHGFDQPYNLFPSLHIALRTILAEHYARHTKGILRLANHVWFSLIGFSTLLTYQHHFVDIVGGFLLAAFCFYVFREANVRADFIPNRKIGAYYATASIVCLIGAFAAWPWTSVLLWSALALAIAASGYWWFGPGIYGKINGKLPLSARLILAPVQFGQYLSLLHYKRQGELWNEISPEIWIGAQLNQREAVEARQAGVAAVLDMTAEFSEPNAFRDLAYCNVRVLDLTELTLEQLNRSVDFISQQARSGIVYVHCKAGYSRSAAVLGSYLLASGRAGNLKQALEQLRSSRPGIIFRPEVFAALEKFCRNGEFESHSSTIPVMSAGEQPALPGREHR